MIKMRLDGVKWLENKLKSLTKEMSEGIDNDMQDMAVKVNSEQKERAPVDYGTLRSRIIFGKIAKLSYDFAADTDYAAYQEFGTGGLVEIPASLQKEAALYRGKGIRKVNMNAQPFFFAPLFKGRDKLIEMIKKRFK